MDLFDLAAKISLDSSEYEKGLDKAEKAGSNFGAKIKTTFANGAKIAAGAVAALGTGTIALGAAFVKSTGDVAAYGDTIDKQSQKLGLSAQAYQEWDAILQHSGTSVDSLKGGLKTLNSSFDSALSVISATAEADAELEAQLESGAISLDEYNQKYDELYAGAYDSIGALSQLGFSMQEIQDMSGDSDKALSAVISRLQEMPEGAERTALAQDLLGKSAMELGALLNTSAEDTEAMRQRVHELGGVMSDEAVKAAASYQDKLQDMKTALSGLKRTMISDFLPGVSSVMDGLTEIFSGDSDKGIGLISDGIDSIIDKLAEKGPKFLEVGSKIALSIGQSIIDNLPKIAKSGAEIVLQLVNALIEALPGLADTGTEIIVTLIESLTNALPSLLSSAASVVQALATGLTKNAGKLVSAGKDLFVSIVKKLPDAISTIVSMLPDLVTSLVDELLNMTSELAAAGVELFSALLNGLPEIIENIAAVLPELIEAIIGKIGEFVQMFVDVGIQLLTSLVAALPDIIAALVEAVPTIIDSLITAILDSLPLLMDAGVDLFMALIENLPQIIIMLCEAIPEIIQRIIETLFDHLDDIAKTGLELLLALIKRLPEVLAGIGQAIWQIIQKIISSLASLPGKLADFFVGIWNSIKNIFSSVGSWFGNIFGEAWEAIKKKFASWGEFWSGLWTKIKDKFSAIGTAVGDAISNTIRKGINWVFEKIENIINGGIKLINGAIKIINKIPGVEIGYISKLSLPRLAKGGVIDRPTVAEIGEDGAEAVVPLERNTAWIKRVAHELRELLETEIAPYGGSSIYALQSSASRSTQSNAAELSLLRAILDELHMIVAKQDRPIVLDDGTLLNVVDRGLGEIAALKGRGN